MNDSSYRLLPFNFQRLPKKKLLITNIVGEYHYIYSEDFNSLINKKLKDNSDIYYDLKSKHFICDGNIENVIDLLSTKYRSKKAFLSNFTTLHMIVLTLRCNHRCLYCHASSESETDKKWDISLKTLDLVVDYIFRTPSPEIKIEFQGGEPTLNWEAVEYCVKIANKLNRKNNKKLEFVLCTNLAEIGSKQINFIKKNNILISTSLDGPKSIHDNNRVMRRAKSSYDSFIRNLRIIREEIGYENVSALLTCTNKSLIHIEDIIDEYINLGFRGIFFRSLNPYGFAAKDNQKLGYSVDEFIKAYMHALEYIINKNIDGIYFEENMTSLLLKRILTPFSTGFVDLQSPAGAGISGVIYDYDGNIYPCDEDRMLAKTGNKKFKLGSVHDHTYEEIFHGEKLKSLIRKACLDVMPECNWCVYFPYCGCDPVRNYTDQGDVVGYRPSSNFCRKMKGIFSVIFEKLEESDQNVIDVFWSWITQRPLEDVRGVNLPGHSN